MFEIGFPYCSFTFFFPALPIHFGCIPSKAEGIPRPERYSDLQSTINGNKKNDPFSLKKKHLVKSDRGQKPKKKKQKKQEENPEAHPWRQLTISGYKWSDASIKRSRATSRVILRASGGSPQTLDAVPSVFFFFFAPNNRPPPAISRFHFYYQNVMLFIYLRPKKKQTNKQTTPKKGRITTVV